MSNLFFVHETAQVDDDVRIGARTKIWHFSHVLTNVIIGDDCSFGQNCMIGPHVTIGNGVKVQNNVSIYQGIICEDDVFLGPSVVFTNVLNPRSFIKRQHEFKKTTLKKGCSIGANATILCGITIGEYALIGAGATVTRNVPPYALMYGVPAKRRGWVSRAGNKLQFNTQNIAIDPFDQTVYQLIDGEVHAKDSVDANSFS